LLLLEKPKGHVVCCDRCSVKSRKKKNEKLMAEQQSEDFNDLKLRQN